MLFRLVARLVASPLPQIAFRIALALGLLWAITSYTARQPQAKGAQETVPQRQPAIPIQAGQPLPLALNNHSATLLPDGRILVAGGSTNGQPSGARREAYLYNPATGLWAPTGSLGAARYVHFSVLLQSGKVLVGGGRNSTEGPLRSAELYDPAAGTWQPTGALGGARWGATASLISFASNVPGAPSGFVLVAGGRNDSGALNTAELYNPASGIWRATGTNLRDARNLHAASVLPDGTILVAGGYSVANTANPFVGSAETYDPVADRWSVAGPLGSGRENPTATLLHNGRVLLTGGRGPNGSLDSAELFNPVSRTWTSAPRMSTARERHTATLLPNGRLLIAGGLVANGAALASTEIYDPAAQRWENGFTLTQARGTHAAVLLANARVLLIGGAATTDESTALSSVDIHDPASGFWQAQSGPNTRRFAHTATLLPNGKVLVVGGRTTGNTVTTSAELYDPASGVWRNTGGLNAARECHTTTLLNNGLVLVAGGLAGGLLNSAELYNPSTEEWRRVTATLVRPRALHTATLLPDGRVLLAGGQVGANSEQTAELFNPSNESWTAAGSLRSPRNGHTATLLFDGRVLVAGGFPLIGSQTSQNTAELYTPSSDSWAFTNSMAIGRYGHTATLLPNGKVLVVAGLRGNNFAQPTIITGSAELFDPGPLSWATTSTPEGRYTHTATLLPNGKVLIVGGAKLNGPTPVVELYDPARGVSLPFESLGNTPLGTARDLHTATLLPNGKVLIVGGETGDFVPATTDELFDVGLNAPVLSAPSVSEGLWSGPGNPACLTGIRFQGLSEAASGGFQSSATNYPVVQLRRLDNEQTLHLLPDLSATACGTSRGWTNNVYASRAITATTTNGGTGNLHPGTALLTVFVNGVPNTRSVVIAPPGAAIGGTPVVSITGRIFTIDDAGFPANVELRSPTGQSLGIRQTSTNGEYIFEDVPSPFVGTITGTVRNAANNQAIANATVSTSGISTTTASNGTYTLSNVPSGSRTVNVSATGFNAAQATVTVTTGQTVTRDFSLTPVATTGTITGTVVNAANNQTIAGAIVRVISTEQTATTSSNGTFTLSNVPAGTQTLSTSATGFNTFAGTVNVLAGQTIAVTIELPPVATTGNITGTVVNATNNQAIAGATVRVVVNNQTALTSANGAFTLSNVPAGTQTLVISATGFTSIQGTVNVMAGQTINLLPIALQPAVTTGTVTGTVRATSATGPVIAGAQVSISGTNLSATTNSNGAFTLSNVPAGARTLNVSAFEYSPFQGTITVTAGQTLNVTVVLQTFTTTGTVTGTVRNAQTNQTLANATVSILNLNLSTLSASNGTYTLNNVPAGARTLRGTASGFTQTDAAINVTAGQTLVQNLLLAPTPTCTYSLSPTNASFSSAGGSGSFSVTTQAGCARTATSNAPSWLTVTSASGTGSGAVSYSVAANSSSASRSGLISVGGQNYTVTQTGVFVLVDRRTSLGPIPTPCSPPVARSNFFDTSPRVFQWFLGNNVALGDTFRQEFIRPNGTVYTSFTHTADFSGSRCFWFPMDIAGTPAANLLGTWQVRGFFRNAQIYTATFTIESSIGLRDTPQTLSAQPHSGSGQSPAEPNCCAPDATLAALFIWNQSPMRDTLPQPILPLRQWVVPNPVIQQPQPTNEETAASPQQQGSYTITPSGLSPRGNTVIFFPAVVPITFDSEGGAPGARAVRAPRAGGNGSACAQTTTNNQIGGLLSPLDNVTGVSVRLTITNQKAECGLPTSIDAALTNNGGMVYNYARSGLALNGNYRIEPMSGNHRFLSPDGLPDRTVNQLDGPQLGLNFTVQPNVTCPASVTAAANGQASVQICENQMVTLTATGIPGATYSWTGPNYSSTEQNPSFTATIQRNGTYTVTVSVPNCPARSASTTVSVTPAPSANAGTDLMLCQAANGPTVFNLNGMVANGTPQWSVVGSADGVSIQNANSASPTVNVSVVGTVRLRLTVTATEASCVAAVAEVQLTVKAPPAKPTITASGSTTLCANQSVTLSAPAGAAAYLWSNGAQGQSITASEAGSYTVRITNADNCQSVLSDPINVTANSFTVTPGNLNFGATGGTATATVTSTANTCAWTAAKNVEWITLDANGGSGNGSVTYLVAPNIGAQRTGTLTIAGQSYTVTQGADVCPQVTSITPSAFAGTQITITGVNFTGITSLSFPGASNPIEIAASGFSLNLTGTEINVEVPAGARTGEVTLNKLNCSPVRTPSFSVTPTSIRGVVRYALGQTPRAVPGTTVTLTDAANQSVMTDVNGVFEFTGLSLGPYTVRASRPANPALGCYISATDASLVLRAASELATLTDTERLAGDASGNGELSPFDAAMIARYNVGIFDPLNGLPNNAGSWRWRPNELSFSRLTRQAEGERFEAILIGEVTGNWEAAPCQSLQGVALRQTSPAAPALTQPQWPNPFEQFYQLLPATWRPSPAVVANPTQAIAVALPNRTGNPGDTFSLPLTTGDLTGRNVFSYELDLRFNQETLEVLEPAFETAGNLSTGAQVVANPTAGRLRISAFSPMPLTGSGTLLNLRLRIRSTAAPGNVSPLTIQSFRYNEGNPATTTTNGSVVVATPAAAPAVSTAAATNVTTTTATLNGAVNPNGAATDYFFELATNSAFNNPSTTPLRSLPAGGQPVPVNEPVSGLMPNTMYFFRLRAVNSAGPRTSEALSFTTAQSCPVINGLTPGSGVIGSTVTISGSGFIGITEVRFANNVPVAPNIVNDATILVTVPPGAVSGPLTLRKPNCADVNTPSFTVTTCAYSIAPQSANFSAASNSGTVTVTTASGCTWTAVSNAAWLTLPSNPGGNGNGSVSYNVAANPGLARTGTLTIAGQTFTVMQENGCALAITTSSLPNGTLGVNYAPVSLAVSNSTGALQWSLSQGTLPTGLSLNPQTGVIAGQPVALGARTFTVRVTDALGCQATRELTINIDCPLITINPPQLPNGTAGQAYSVLFSQAGGSGAITWTVSAGALPNGLTLNPTTGVLNGTPVSFGATNLTIKATDANGCMGMREYTLTLNPPTCSNITINPATLANGAVGTPYNVTLTQTGGSGTLNWSISAGSLPGGLTLNPTTGLLSGTPNAAGTFNFTVRVTDANNCSGTREFTLVMSCSFALNPTSRDFAASGGSATVNVTAANGCAWTATSNASWLTITAGNSGSGNGTVSYTASANSGAERSASLTIAGINFPVTQQGGSTQTLATISAATFRAPLAPESIAAAFGVNFATQTIAAASTPLPTTLAGSTLRVRDSAGVERLAPLFFVSPGQINYQVPAGTALGLATVIVTNAGGQTSVGTVQIAVVGPGWFTANASGQGVPAGVVFRISVNGAQTFEPLSRIEGGNVVPVPINLGPTGDQIFLVLFGTGFRGLRTLGNASVTIGGVTVPVSFAGPQGDLVGLDQCNLGPLPRSLAGRGLVDLVLTVEGQTAPAVQVRIQ